MKQGLGPFALEFGRLMPTCFAQEKKTYHPNPQIS
jgi:hypothetical protein